MAQDYDALAEKARKKTASSDVDYDALAEKARTPQKESKSQPSDVNLSIGGKEQSTPVGGLSDVAGGIARGFGSSIVGAGQLVTSIPGVGSAIEAVNKRLYGPTTDTNALLKQARTELYPQTMAGKLGYYAEQASEFLVGGIGAEGSEALATRLLPKIPRALRSAGLEAAGAATIAKTQDTSGTVAGGLAAAGPLGAAAAKTKAVQGSLEALAETQVVRALGATRQRYIAMAEKLTGQVLDRGTWAATRAGLAQKASALAATARVAIKAFEKNIGPNVPVPTQMLTDLLEDAKKPFIDLVPVLKPGKQNTYTGHFQTVIKKAEPVQNLDRLKDLVQHYGPTMTVQQLAGLRRTWDLIVGPKGGYAERAATEAHELLVTEMAWAERQGGNAIRSILDTKAPKLAELNKEYSYWRGIRDITRQAVRQQKAGTWGQTIGQQAVKTGVPAAIAVGGSLLGESGVEAVLTGATARIAQQLFTSTGWRLASAQIKHRLATALMSGRTETIARVLLDATAATATETSQAIGREETPVP